MYEGNENQILQPHEFFLPFAGELDAKNRWCRMALYIPWAEMEQQYLKKLLGLGRGRKALSVRMALGSVLIAQQEGYTDEAFLEAVMENPYMQYFLGLSGFKQEPLFDPSLMVYFRRRLSGEPLARISEMVAISEAKRRMEEKAEKERKREERTARRRKDPPDDGTAGSSPDDTGAVRTEQMHLDNMGEMILDATCIPADIHFPTDIRLLHEAREWTERCIDKLHAPDRGKVRRPRTYREKACQVYLNMSKSKKLTIKVLRKGIRKQLQYLARNLRIIDAYEAQGRHDLLSKSEQERLSVCRLVLAQQQAHYDTGKSPPQRIVSLHMPFVRPIKRGKAGADTEFGLKLAVSLVEGMVFIEKASFENFNEGVTLIESVERYRERFGYYPRAVLADQLYRNRDNLDYCKKHNIHLSGKPLGRPKKDPALKRLMKTLLRIDAGMRNAVEGKFGEAKRCYGLDRVFAKTTSSFLAKVYAACVCMNLQSILRFLFWLFQRGFLHAFYRSGCFVP